MAIKPYDRYNELTDVHWDDPNVQDLMRKIKQLSIEQRDGKPSRKLILSQLNDLTGTSLTAFQAADDGEGNLVLVGAVPLNIGETFLVQTVPDPRFPASSRLCTVRHCRHGQRAEEQSEEVYVSYLNCK
jgi:hypothetical protein